MTSRDDDPMDAGWSEAIRSIGKDFSEGERIVAADAIDASSIRRLCEVLELDSALYHDREVARSLGHRDIVAPWSGISLTFTDPGLWHPGEPTRYPFANRNAPPASPRALPELRVPLPGPCSFLAVDLEIEYFKTVCAGDRLSIVGCRLLDVTPKATRLGSGAFLKFEKEIRDQRDDLIAVMRRTVFAYLKPDSEAPPTHVSREAGNDPAPQRYWEDVAPGDRLRSLDFALTVDRLVAAAGATRDFAAVHHDADAAKAAGAPDMFASNALIQGIWERMIRSFIGQQGAIMKVGPLRISDFSLCGETIVTEGKVKNKWLVKGEGCVELRLWSSTERGPTVGAAPVLVRLPCRRQEHQ